MNAGTECDIQTRKKHELHDGLLSSPSSQTHLLVPTRIPVIMQAHLRAQVMALASTPTFLHVRVAAATVAAGE